MPDSDPPCLQPNCVLFSGTLLDNDTDDSLLFLNTIGVTFSPGPTSGDLTIDNTFYDSTDYVPGVLSGDLNYVADGLPTNAYSGDIFGIDIAPGTPFGVYTGTVTINAAGGTNDPNGDGFIVTQIITVDVVSPEPAAGSLALGGLLALTLSYRLKRKWHSSEASR